MELNPVLIEFVCIREDSCRFVFAFGSESPASLFRAGTPKDLEVDTQLRDDAARFFGGGGVARYSAISGSPEPRLSEKAVKPKMSPVRHRNNCGIVVYPAGST